jgi:phenylacetic acid degradation operon negative regulatory protein
MDALDVDPQSVRSAMSRLKRRGVIESAQRNGSPGYALTASALAVLAAGDRRIHRERAIHADTGWLLAVFSVPETERRYRHQLTTRLKWLGFGRVAPGVMIAPAHIEEDVTEALARAELNGYVDLFKSQFLTGPDPTSIAAYWDLDELSAMYAEFLAYTGPIYRKWEVEASEDSDGAAFADLIRVTTAWRQLPYLDPGLPVSVLPSAWNGDEANEIFESIRSQLLAPARAYVAQVTQLEFAGDTDARAR